MLFLLPADSLQARTGRYLPSPEQLLLDKAAVSGALSLLSAAVAEARSRLGAAVNLFRTYTRNGSSQQQSAAAAAADLNEDDGLPGGSVDGGGDVTDPEDAPDLQAGDDTLLDSSSSDEEP